MAVRVLCNCESDQDFEAANSGFDFKWGPGLRFGDPDSRACLSMRIEEIPSDYISPIDVLLGNSYDEEGRDLLTEVEDYYSHGEFFIAPEARDYNDQFSLMAARAGDPDAKAEEEVAHQIYLVNGVDPRNWQLLDEDDIAVIVQTPLMPAKKMPIVVKKRPAADEFFYEFGSRLPTCIGSRKFAAFINHFVISVKEAHEERRTYSKHGRKSRVARVRGENAFA